MNGRLGFCLEIPSEMNSITQSNPKKVPNTGREINIGHRTMSNNNAPMSGRNYSLLDILSGRKMQHAGHTFLFFVAAPSMLYRFSLVDKTLHSRRQRKTWELCCHSYSLIFEFESFLYGFIRCELLCTYWMGKGIRRCKHFRMVVLLL